MNKILKLIGRTKELFTDDIKNKNEELKASFTSNRQINKKL